MKFSKLSQLFLVSIIGLSVAALLTSCAINTIDYVFVANSSGSGSGTTGQIQTFDSDSGTGALRIGQATVSSGGIGPVSMAVTADFANLYVVNQASNNVVHFAVAGNGVLTQKDVVTTSANPVAVAVNTAQTYLYVVSGPNPSQVTAYPLTSGAIGSALAPVPLSLAAAGFASDTIVPTGINVLANNKAVYVSAYDQTAYNPGGATASTANPGWVFGFDVGSGGALTTVAQNTPASSPWKAGIKPSALVSDPTNRFVYVTDFASNELIGYTIQSGSTLAFLINGPFKTGNEPNSIAIDPRGIYLYISNGLDSTVSAYVISLSTGTPSAAVNVTGSQTNSTDTTPVAVAVDPAIGRFVYTANQLGNSLSGFVLNPDTGALQPTQSTPYPAGQQPSALAVVPHGNHAIQVVSP
ncbi:MAG: beta-propeller fold lactonase family protein [Terracidiphilus sp.]|nr:beta-propeller fold lactonase family protein [Terracidiphilus sp.]